MHKITNAVAKYQFVVHEEIGTTVVSQRNKILVKMSEKTLNPRHTSQLWYTAGVHISGISVFKY